MRKLLIIVISLVAVFFLVTRFSEVQEMVAVMKAGDWHFIMLAILVELLWLANVNAGYHALYHALGIPENRRRLFVVANAASFLTVMIPSGGMTALAVFLNDARKRGHSTGRVTLACILYLLFDYLGLLAFLMVGMTLLASASRLHWSEITAGVILAFMSVVMICMLLLAGSRPQLLGRILARLITFWNRLAGLFHRSSGYSREGGLAFARQIAEGMQVIRANPKGLLLPIGLSLSNKLLLLASLFLVFNAFQVPITPLRLVAGFSLGYLFAIVSPTPSGVGVVEGVLALALVSLGISVEKSTIVVLGYRGVTFWLPWLIGMISFRRLSGKSIPLSKDRSPIPSFKW
jgi:uncharacterized protein (TIRG00374 family)